MPQFAVVAQKKGDRSWLYNDESLVSWKWKFNHFNYDDEPEIETVPCIEWAESQTDLTQDQINQYKSEFRINSLPNLPTLCPNISSFELSIIGQGHDFILEVELSDDALDFDGTIELYTAETSRYFNAETFEDLGYQYVSTITNDFRHLIPDTKIVMIKEVAETHIQFYPFRMIDTESISFANFGKEFVNYHVESFIPSIRVPPGGKNGGAEIVYA